MRIGNFTIWTSVAMAKGYGCTHHARIYGIIPGFIGDPHGNTLWVSRSDLLNPFEDALGFMQMAVCNAMGHEPTFPFRVGREIEE